MTTKSGKRSGELVVLTECKDCSCRRKTNRYHNDESSRKRQLESNATYNAAHVKLDKMRNKKNPNRVVLRRYRNLISHARRLLKKYGYNKDAFSMQYSKAEGLIGMDLETFAEFIDFCEDQGIYILILYIY